MSVSVRGKDGKELAKNAFKVETSKDQQQSSQTTLGKSENTKKIVKALGIILAVICIILIIFILCKKRKAGIKIFVLGLIFTGSVFISKNTIGETVDKLPSNATTNAYTMQDYLYATYRANFNKSQYKEGESITVTSSGTFYVNASDKFTIDVYDSMSGPNSKLIYSETKSGLNGTTINYPTIKMNAAVCSGCGQDYNKRFNFGKDTETSVNGKVHVGGHFIPGSVRTDFDCSNSGTPRQGECGYLGSTSYGNGVNLGYDVPNPIDSKCGTANGKTHYVAMPSESYSFNSANDCVWLRLIDKDGFPSTPSETLCAPGMTDFPACSAVKESSGKINWTCYGQDGGSDANCSATVTQVSDPVCTETCPTSCGYSGGTICGGTKSCGATSPCSPAPICNGDGLCNGAETCSNCPSDCGSCCSTSYTCQYSPADYKDLGFCSKSENEGKYVNITSQCIRRVLGSGCPSAGITAVDMSFCSSLNPSCSPKVINCSTSGGGNLPGGYREVAP